MVSQVSTPLQPEIIYPDSDGKPMSDNTKQFRWIVFIQQNLAAMFAHDANVFVAGDLLWYPVEGDNKTRYAPDAMVIFGRPRSDCGSYQQWKEEHIAPQVVFEILSPGNTQTEMNKKLLFYDRYGVEEYYCMTLIKTTSAVGCVKAIASPLLTRSPIGSVLGSTFGLI
jgi:Uma2 family endonuclease